MLYNRYNNFKKSEKSEAKSIKFGLISLLKSEIVKTHEKCLKKGICTIYEMELVEDIYKNYTQLGGNGCAEKLVNDLKKLPLQHLKTEPNLKKNQ